MKKMLISISLLIFAAWLLLCFALWHFQHQSIYHPSPEHVASPDDMGLQYEDVYLQTDDGVLIHSWYIPSVGAENTLYFLHGNAGNISHRLESIGIFHRLGLNVFIIDYHGYGKSKGRPGEQESYHAAMAGWRFLVEGKNIEESNIVLFGRSLGGAVAAWLATQVKPAAVILESTFTSIPDIAAHYYPYIPVKWLSRIKYPSLDLVSEFQSPLLIIHSREDELIPFSHGQTLFKQASELKVFLPIQGGHNRGYSLSGRKYTSGIQDFLLSNLSSASEE